jgi:hypothetical protein
LIIREGNESSIEPTNRDIVIRIKGQGNGLARINELHQHYDSLQYVLMFPFGDSGWNISIKSYDPQQMEIDEPANQVD